MEAQFDLVFAERADGVIEVNLSLIQRDVELSLKLVSDHAGRNGAEHLAVLAGLDGDDCDELGNAARQFAHGVELMRFAFGAALFERFKPPFI